MLSYKRFKYKKKNIGKLIIRTLTYNAMAYNEQEQKANSSTYKTT